MRWLANCLGFKIALIFYMSFNVAFWISRKRSTYNCCIDEKVKSFYRSANGILRIEGKSNEMVMLQLLEAHCVSILTYAIEIIHVVDRDERRRLRVAYNSIFRRVFEYKTWESVTELQHALQRPTWDELVNKRTAKFRTRISQCDLLSNIS